MARPKSFDRDVALRRAMELFWAQGYEATSTDDLLAAMGIGRQSMYDTFGDKHRLYLAALRLYRDEQRGSLEQSLSTGGGGLASVAATLEWISTADDPDRPRGCMLVNATTERAGCDSDVRDIVSANVSGCELLFEHAVRSAVAAAELPRGVDPRAAAQFLMSTVQGMRVSAKAGVPPEALRAVARFAVAALTNREVVAVT